MTERLRLRTTDLDWHTLDGEIVVLDAAASRYVGINTSGRRLWEALQEGTTEVELRKLLVDAYGLDAATAREDVERFLTTLRDLGLLDSRQQ